MRKIVILAAAAALAALMALAPAAIARHGHASCTRADRNHDSIPDKWECKNRLSLRVKQTRRDPDHDGLNNLKEFKRGTNPRKADTDGDGIRDGAEVHRGLNPRSDDSDHDGVDDENELAGTIASFDQGTDNDPSTGTLTITPAGGGDPVSGQVTAATRIECEGADEFENEDSQPTTTARASRDGGDDATESGDDHSGDNSGPGTENSGPGSTTSGGDDQGDDNQGGCTTADLTPNTMVHEAKLENGTFTKVELVK
jgi:hypothetical protein